MKKVTMNDQLHIPVLLDHVLDVLKPQPGESYLDLTAGYGGHAAAVLERLGPDGSAVLVDRDQNAIAELQARFASDPRVTQMHDDYLSALTTLAEAGKTYDCILADIGVSSPHLDNPDRGFSFMQDGPLDMRMDNRAPVTAADIVNTYSAEDLANVLFRFGELRQSRSLARVIIEHRPYGTTHELAAIIPGPYERRMRICAQVFQALRIVVNDELGQLERSLPLMHRVLKPGGRLALITFHSLEDRIVKQYFAEHGADVYGNDLVILTKKPLVGTDDELVFNPRARSAKLRALQRK